MFLLGTSHLGRDRCEKAGEGPGRNGQEEPATSQPVSQLISSSSSRSLRKLKLEDVEATERVDTQAVINPTTKRRSHNRVSYRGPTIL